MKRSFSRPFRNGQELPLISRRDDGLEVMRHHPEKDVIDGLPLHLQPGWLNAVCAGADWEMFTASLSQRPIANWVVQWTKRGLMQYARSPMLSPYMDPFQQTGNVSATHSVISRKQELKALVGALPRFAIVRQQFAPDSPYGIAAAQLGIADAKGHTRVLDLSNSIEALWEGISSNQRRDIRRADDRLVLRLGHDGDLPALWALQSAAFTRSKSPSPYFEEGYLRAVSFALANDFGNVFVAESNDGIEAAVFVAAIGHRATYLSGGYRPGPKSRGAVAALLWEAVQHFHARCQWFDFEGSSIPSIDRFFAALGGTATQTWLIMNSRVPGLKALARRFV